MSIDRQTVWLAMQLSVGTLIAWFVWAKMVEGDIGATVTNKAIISEMFGLLAAWTTTKAICFAYDAFRWLFLRDR
jgi:hypothetical protein